MRDDSSNGPDAASPEKKTSSLRLRAILGGAALGVLAAFAGGIWYAYVNADDARFQSPPLIEAPKTPAKTRPENPGGLQVPDKDKLVLKSLDGEEEPQVEKLLPPPERPLDEAQARPAEGEKPAETGTAEIKQGDAIAGKIAELERQDAANSAAEAVRAQAQNAADAADSVRQTGRQAETAVKEQPPVTAPEPAMPAPPKPMEPTRPQKTQALAKAAGDVVNDAMQEAKTAPVAEKNDARDEKAASPAEKPAVKKAEKKAPAPVLPKKFRVQLGAFKTADIAEEGWRRLSKKFPAILGRQPHYVIAVTLGSRGVFHRLQFGAFDSREQAKSVCARLKAKKQDCLVVAP